MNTPLTFFTCSIFPDVTRIWYHCLSKIDRALYKEIVIYDSSGTLNPAYFPGCRIIKFPNKQHGLKIDHFIKENLATEYCFLLDDDAFLLNEDSLKYGLNSLDKGPSSAIVSFKPRDWWKINVDGRLFDPMGSYALMFRKSLIIDSHLSFQVRMTENKAIRNGSGYYDTGDYINELLLHKGYEIDIAPAQVRNMIPTFFGTSSGFLMTFKKKWLSREYRMRDREKCLKIILENGSNFARAYAVANTIELHNTIFNEKSSFGSFFKTNQLLDLLPPEKDGEFMSLVKKQIERSDIITKAILSL